MKLEQRNFYSSDIRLPWMKECKMDLVTVETLPAVIAHCSRSSHYALDIETTGLDRRVFGGETKDKIVGVCLSPDGVQGYYIPIRHTRGSESNIPWSVFRAEFMRLRASPAVAIFHNAKFDQEFLEFSDYGGLGSWDDLDGWEDTLALAFLQNSKALRIGLKTLAKDLLGLEMLELQDLFAKKGQYNFSNLDPTDEKVAIYGCSDAICTYRLFQHYNKTFLKGRTGQNEKGLLQRNVSGVYRLEKGCILATRWMERARIMIDKDKVRELIQMGQTEWLSSVQEVYTEINKQLGRDTRCAAIKLLLEDEDLKFDPKEINTPLKDQIDRARQYAKDNMLDPVVRKGKAVVTQTVQKEVQSLTVPKKLEKVDFPVVYDITKPEDLGLLFRELDIKGLKLTATGSIQTTKDDLDEITDKYADTLPSLGKIKKFRSIVKALSTYLYPLWKDAAPDNSVAANFNALSADTGRFSVKSSRSEDGGTSFPFHGTPATYDPSRPECLSRIRECIVARKGKTMAACIAEGSLVHTTRGWVPIEDVKEGDYVINAISGDNPTISEVTRHINSGVKGVLKIVTKRGAEVRATPDHRFQIMTAKGLVWRAAEDLRPDDWIIRSSDSRGVTAQERDREAKLLGFFMGISKKGYKIKSKTKSLSFQIQGVTLSDCHEKLTMLQELLKQQFPDLEMKYKTQERGPELRVIIESTDLCSWVSETVTHDRLPSRVFLYDDQNLREFFHGFFVSNLRVKMRKYAIYYLSKWQPRKMLDIQLLLSSLGIQCKIVKGFGGGEALCSIAIGVRGMERVEKLFGLVMPTDANAYSNMLLANHKITSKLDIVPSYMGTETSSRPFMRFSDFASQRGLTPDNPNYDLALESVPHYHKNKIFDQVYSVEPDGDSPVYDITVPDVSQFVANGFVVHNCDYSGVELRIVTNLSREKLWLTEYFRCAGCDYRFDRGDGSKTPEAPPKNCPKCGSDKIGDLHTLTALSIYGADAKSRPDWKQLRQYAKGVNFALCYGGSGNAVCATIGCSKDEGMRIKKKFDATYQGLQEWWEKQKDRARTYKRVTTAFGRWYPTPEIDDEDGGMRSKAERNSINSPIQGTSADITKIAMWKIYEMCRDQGWFGKVNMLITMHDELVFEIDDELVEEVLPQITQNMILNDDILDLKWPVPLTSDVELGPDWTVPWNTSYAFDAGKWSEPFIKLFPKAYQKYLDQKAGSSTETVQEKEEAKPVPAPQSKLPQADPVKATSSVEYKLKRVLLDTDLPYLMQAIKQSHAPSGSLVTIVSPTDSSFRKTLGILDLGKFEKLLSEVGL